MTKTIQRTIHQFAVIVHEAEEGGYWVECPAIDGCYSQGETIDEALKNIREVMEMCLEGIPKEKQGHLAKQGVSLHFVHI